MDITTFRSLMTRARNLHSEYGDGYRAGLRRHYHGETAAHPSDIHAVTAAFVAGDPRVELGRGFRDGLAGRDPSPLIGRPPLPEGQGRTARIEWRTTEARKQRAQELAARSGQTLSAWIDGLIDDI